MREPRRPIFLEMSVQPLVDVRDENPEPIPKPDLSDEPNSSTLQWVSIDRPGTRLDPRQMSTVRSHVMRRYKQEQGQIRREQEAREQLRNEALSPGTVLSVHQNEALRPELNALAQALGMDLESDNQQSPSSVSDSNNSASGRRKLPSTNWKAFKPKKSERLGYSPKPGEEYEPPVIYCIVCGAPECTLHRSNRRQKSTQMGGSRHTHLRSNFEPSPLELLGAGRVNPFIGTYPVDEPKPYLHELMDHALTYLLPGLVPEGMGRELKSVSQAWFSSALKFPFLFHALIFAGSVHLDFLRYGKIYPNKTLALSHKLSVIQALKRIMQEPEKAAAIDEVILSVSVLSSHEVLATSSESQWSPWNSPLKTLTWLDVYGNIAYVPEHSKAVMDLVTMRGGLENIKLYGLAEVIAGGDVNGATSTLTKPTLPLMRRSKSYIDDVRRWAKTAHNFATARLCHGFQRFQDPAMTKAREVFAEMGDLTAAIDNYLQGRPRCLKLGVIAVARFSVQHRLMSLPHANEAYATSPPGGREDVSNVRITASNRYEACLAAAMIYSVAVIFPVPNARRIMQPLVGRLEHELSPLVVLNYEDGESDLLLWMLVLGGIAALETHERTWFVENLATFVRKWEVSTWKGVERIMEQFLWLESACGPGGKLLWVEVMARRILP